MREEARSSPPNSAVPQGDLEGRTPGPVDRTGDELLQTPEALVAWLGGLGWRLRALDLVLVGDGAVRYEAFLRQVPNARFAATWLASPPVGVLAAMGVELARNGEFEDPLTLAARYVRHADARINWETRAPRQVAGR